MSAMNRPADVVHRARELNFTEQTRVEPSWHVREKLGKTASPFCEGESHLTLRCLYGEPESIRLDLDHLLWDGTCLTTDFTIHNYNLAAGAPL